MSQETIEDMQPDEVNPGAEMIVESPENISVPGDDPTVYQLADQLLAVVAQANRKLGAMQRDAAAADVMIAELRQSAALLTAQAAQLTAENRLRLAEIQLIRTDIRIARTNLANAQRENS